MTATRTLVLLLGFVLAPVATAEEDLPYPPGESRHTLEGLRTTLLVPEDISAENPASLLVGIHGAGGTARGMAQSLSAWTDAGFVVCAPKSRGIVWEPAHVEAVARIAKHLLEVLPIDPDRVHVLGYSNGGAFLPTLAFDEELKPVTATWVAAGHPGGQVPRWARDRLGVIALAGSEDEALPEARRTLTALRGKVRTLELRIEPGLGHSWPMTLMPYLLWWMGVHEGRFVPGEDRGFDWQDDLDAAIASQAGRRRGGVFLWLWSPEDAESEDARAFQHEVLLDPDVREYGNRLACVRLPATPELLERFELETTPAVVVLDEDGDVKQTFGGRIATRKLASALRSVAPRR
jgi:hypothetical protein